ncbi:MAG: hypothetical protein ACRERE_29560 [Candidatus Entotheonellia bacterium]
MQSMAAAKLNASSAEEQYQAALEAVTAPSFRAAPAREKQEILWRFISKFPYEQLPSMHTTNLQLMRRLMSRAFLQKAFDLDDDVRPPRTKAFHAFGTVAQMRFVADGTHPFTGLFATGGVGFARASLAVGMPNYSPAAALKFLLDGPHASENLLLHQSLDTQASRDFFERAPTNHTLEPSTFPNTLMTPLLRFWLSRISSPIEIQLLDHLAAVTHDGTVVERVVAPELVYLYGADEVRNDPASTEDFRSLLANIPLGSLLYRMYGKATRSARQIYIGSITTESAFVASEFGDRILAFQHAWGSKGSSA